jgi:superoxide dismutase, Fe-Mn family
MMTRREALKTTALATAAVATILPAVNARQAAPAMMAPAAAATGPFTLPALPYAYDALEPHIDAETMHIHHDKHHAAYVANLNKAIAEHTDLEKKSIEELIGHLGALPGAARTAIQNNGGGHYNHSLFWQMMAKGGGGDPKGDLAGAIDKSFKDFTNFKAAFTMAATGRFGSGWAWLVLDPDKRLAIESSANQDSPISAGKNVVLGIDVWEHAYYLKYQNKRPDYIAAWFNVVNWDFATERYQKLMA